MKKAWLLVLLLIPALATSQSGITLPAGSSTLRSIHLQGYPGLGIYSPSAGTLAFGSDSEGFSCVAGGACTLTASGTMVSTLAANSPGSAGAVWGVSGRLDFEGATANDFETEITVTDPTADRLVTLPNISGTAVLANVFNLAIPDSGGAGAATYTLQAAGYRLATLSCLDADGCTVTMGETGLVTGDSITIIQIAAASGNITLVDDDGTTAELDGDANLVFNTLDSATLFYTPGTWVITAYIDIS